MKNTGKCPKCNSSEIARFNQYWSGGSQTQGIHIRTGFLRGAELRLYVFQTVVIVKVGLTKKIYQKLETINDKIILKFI